MEWLPKRKLIFGVSTYVLHIFAVAMLVATPTSWHGATLADEGFKIGMNLVGCRRRIKTIHNVVHVAPIPWVFEDSSATNHGVQILVLSDIDVLVRRQIHHGQLCVINEKATNREQNEGNESSNRHDQPGKGSVLFVVTIDVDCDRYGKG